MTRRMVFAMVAVLLSSVSIGLAAEEEGKEKKRPDRGPGGGEFALVEKLSNVTDTQKEQIAKIKAELGEAMKAAREAKDREAGQKAVAAAHEKLHGVLTEDQKAELKKLVDEAKAKRGERGGDKPKKERKPE